jgi:hypothetical protein
MGECPSVDFETFDFSPSYAVETEPELPSDGRWRSAAFSFDGETGTAQPGLDGIGAAVVVRFSTGSDGWVGRFPGWVPARDRVMATPDPARAVVVSGSVAFMVDTTSPESGAEVLISQVREIAAATAPALLLIGSWTALVAVGPAGLAWKTRRLAIDDLAIRSIGPEAIVCDCDNPAVGGVRRIELDPRDGHQIAGSVLPDPFTTN